MKIGDKRLAPISDEIVFGVFLRDYAASRGVKFLCNCVAIMLQAMLVRDYTGSLTSLIFTRNINQAETACIVSRSE
jgi:hypothetical protein